MLEEMEDGMRLWRCETLEDAKRKGCVQVAEEEEGQLRRWCLAFHLDL